MKITEIDQLNEIESSFQHEHEWQIDRNYNKRFPHKYVGVEVFRCTCESHFYYVKDKIHFESSHRKFVTILGAKDKLPGCKLSANEKLVKRIIL